MLRYKEIDAESLKSFLLFRAFQGSLKKAGLDPWLCSSKIIFRSRFFKNQTDIFEESIYSAPNRK